MLFTKGNQGFLLILPFKRLQVWDLKGVNVFNQGFI